MAVNDNDLGETVRGNFGAHSIKQLEDQGTWKRERAGLVHCFVDLAIKEIGKDNCVFTFCGQRIPFTHMDKIGTEGRIRSVLFEYPDG